MIRLVQMDLAAIAAARGDRATFLGFDVVDGGLPPSFILDGAAEALRAGRPLRWLGPFLFVDADAQRIVGSGIFKGEPSAGWVEIGYGIADSAQRRGHATEAVFALVRHAFEQPDVHTVYAETSVGNLASRRVVQKVGFAWAGQRESRDDGPVDCWFVEAT